MDKKNIVSVIISTKNEASNLPRLFISLKKQTYKHIEIIIVDNFSSDNTLEIAKKYTDNVYSHGNERSVQRNFGVKNAKGNYLLFLDADMEVPQKLIEECIATIKKGYTALILPETNIGSNLFSRIKKIEKEIYLNESNIEAARFYVKKAYESVGGYNINLTAGEDWDLSERITSVGKIGRIKKFINHHENSFIREIRHKMYYIQSIAIYRKFQTEKFKSQSGIDRIKMIWKKRGVFSTDPLAASLFILLKGFEYILFIIYKKTA